MTLWISIAWLAAFAAVATVGYCFSGWSAVALACVGFIIGYVDKRWLHWI